MPWWSTILLALGGILLGGAWSLHRQKAPVWTRIAFVILAAMAIIAAFLTLPWAD